MKDKQPRCKVCGDKDLTNYWFAVCYECGNTGSLFSKPDSMTQEEYIAKSREWDQFAKANNL